MSSTEAPSIGELLKPIDKSMKISSRTENYLQYFDFKKDRNENEVQRKENSMDVSNNFYDLATDFYEYGWGDSFHFAVLSPGESREHSFAKYEYTLALKLGLKQGDLVLDLGCGIGGPARHIALFSEAKVVGLNCNDYQLKRAKDLTLKAHLEHLCSYVKGDFNNLSYDDCTFDKVYAIEATCHSHDLSKVYGEAYRVLKPGGMFAVYEWVMTAEYDDENSYHRRLKDDILEGDGLADLATVPEVLAAVKKVGFEVIEARDRCQISSDPWYSVLQPRRTLSDLKSTPLGRWLTHIMLMTLEAVGLAPKGSVIVHRTLCKGADALVAAGQEGIFTPMFLMVLKKPDNN